MTNSLLEKFLAQECTPYVRRLLEDAIANVSAHRQHLEFNRFEVTIELGSNMVLLEDVLDATDSGSQRLSLGEFTVALTRCSSS